MNCQWRAAPENPGSPSAGAPRRQRPVPSSAGAARSPRASATVTGCFSPCHRRPPASHRSGFLRDPADGEAAFQEVFHVHLHVIPRTAGDGFRIRAKWRRPSRTELDSVAEQVRDGSGGPAG
jgi:hypothetical protein